MDCLRANPESVSWSAGRLERHFVVEFRFLDYSFLPFSVHPDFLIYTEKEITPDGAIKYHLYSGYPTSEELTDLEGNKLKRRSMMLNCLEAGEEAYLERSKTYEVSLH